MRSIFIFLALGLLCLTTGCTSKTVVTPIPVWPPEASQAEPPQTSEHPGSSEPESEQPKAVLNGIPYALPLTVVTANVTVKRVEDTKGPYAAYAPCFFHELRNSDLLNNVTISDSIRYQVTNASFTTRGVPDASHVFVIDSSAGWLTKKTLNVTLQPDGRLSASDVQSTNEALSFTISTVKSLAAIAGNILSVSTLAAVSAMVTTPNNISKQPIETNPALIPLAECSRNLENTSKDMSKIVSDTEQDKNTQDTAKKFADVFNEAKTQVDALSHQLQFVCPKKDDKGFCESDPQTAFDTSDYKFASDIFDELTSLERQRERALSSLPQGGLTSDTLKELASEYSALESKYAGNFVGTETTDMWTPTFDDIQPDTLTKVCSASNSQTFALFKYDSQLGVLLEDKYASTVQLPAKFKASANPNNPAVAVSIVCNPTQMAGHIPPPETLKDERSYYYRVPAMASVSLVADKKNFRLRNGV